MRIQATHIFLFQLLNIGGITLLIAANSRVQQNRAEAQEASAALEATGDGDEGSGAAPSPPPEMWWAQLTTGGDYSAAGRYDFALDYRWYEITASSVLLMLLTLVLSSGGWPFFQATRTVNP